MHSEVHTSENLNELFTALAVVQGKVAHAKRTAENPAFASKYATLPDVIDANKALLAENGLCVTQIPTGNQLISILGHKSGQFISSSMPLLLLPSATMQEMTACITYARRTAFQALIGMAAENDDDDGNAASGRAGAQGSTPAAGATSQPLQPPREAKPEGKTPRAKATGFVANPEPASAPAPAPAATPAPATPAATQPAEASPSTGNGEQGAAAGTQGEGQGQAPQTLRKFTVPGVLKTIQVADAVRLENAKKHIGSMGFTPAELEQLNAAIAARMQALASSGSEGAAQAA